MKPSKNLEVALGVFLVAGATGEVRAQPSSMIPTEKEITLVSGEEAEQKLAAKPLVPNGILIGLKAGLFLPQPAGRFNAGPSGALEVAYLIFSRNVGLMFQLGYDQLSAHTTAQDPRVPDGHYDLSLTERDLHTSFGLLGRIDRWSVVPSFGALFRLHFQESVVSGSAGTPLGEHREISNEPGGAAFVGAEVRLGPGSVLGEIEAQLVRLSHRITGSSYSHGLTGRLGYRLVF